MSAVPGWTARREPVEVAGYAAASCLGEAPEAIWRALEEEAWGFSELELPVQNRPRVKVGLIPELGPLESPDRLERLGALLLEQVLDDGSLGTCGVGTERCALYLGISLGALESPEPMQATVRRLAARFGFRQWRCISSACASGADAIGLAAAAIGRGWLDAAVCGGIDVVDVGKLAGHQAAGTLSPTTCRPFDAARDGTALADGGALLILRRRKEGFPGALTLRGYGTAADASGLTAPSADGRGAVLAMTRALASAGLELGEIGYINAHGSGTAMNDLVEAMALDALGAREIPLSSTKGGTGHCLGAAGAVEAVICLEALRRRRCPPNVRLQEALPEHELAWVRAGGEPLARPAALSNSFGFGGSCTTLVFSGGKA